MITTGFRISREWGQYQYETKWENNKIAPNRKVSHDNKIGAKIRFMNMKVVSKLM